MGRILCGDSLEMLKTLPDCSVDCCVTSPPYYGLRDYGTGKWVGGDPNCEHKGNPIRTREHINENYGHGFKDVKGKMVFAPYKQVCPLCGAKREDYQIGLEETPEEFIERLVLVFSEVRRVLKPDGTCWVNMGDSYWGSGSRGYDFTGKLTSASDLQSHSKGTIDLSRIPKLVGLSETGIKNKDLIGIPWMLAFALRADGWYLRQDIIWQKPNPMPESVRDRCTKSHEYIFLLSKSSKYYFDNDAIKEGAKTKPTARDKNKEGYKADYAKGDRFSPGERVYGADGRRNKRDVWRVPVQPVKEAHFATFPEKLIEPCILAGCKQGGGGLRPILWERNNRNCSGTIRARLHRDRVKSRICEDSGKAVKRRANAVADCAKWK